jgi:hypothetical protein
MAGPGAHVRIYASGDPDGFCVWLLPGQSAEDLVELRVGDDLDSLQLLDRPCAKGEPGYALFLLARQKHESRNR